MTTPDSTPTPASVDSVMALAKKYGNAFACLAADTRELQDALRAEVERLAAQSAPLAQQAREYPPLPKLPTMTVLSELQSGTQEMVWLDVAHEAMRAYIDADRAAAQVEPPSMPSSEWLAEAERIAGEFTVAVANGESAAAALAYSNLRAHLSKRITADEVRMLTDDEREEVMDRRMNDYDGTENIAVMLQRAFCRVNAGRVIPADGEVRG